MSLTAQLILKDRRRNTCTKLLEHDRVRVQLKCSFVLETKTLFIFNAEMCTWDVFQMNSSQKIIFLMMWYFVLEKKCVYKNDKLTIILKLLL